MQEEIIAFQELLPKIEGKIISLPKAGTIGVKFNDNKINIHEGMKLVAKRKPNSSRAGVLYLKYNKNKKLVGRYTRSQVGKFEINDIINSKWHTPSFAISFLKNDVNDNQELVINLRNKLLENNNGIKLVKTEKVNVILNKISKIKDTNREMKKLFGQGVDYLITGNFQKGERGNFLEISILSTYTNKVIFSTKIDTNLWFLFFKVYNSNIFYFKEFLWRS